MIRNRIFAWLLAAVMLAGCASSGPASVAGRGNNDWRPDVYIVQKGDTLYSIAFNYGFDYHELAQLNGIQDPSMISIGQKIRLFPGGSKAANPGTSAQVNPIDILVKDQPKLVKYPYSEAAMAQIDKVQEQTQPETTAVAAAQSVPQPPAAPVSQPDAAASDNTANDGEDTGLQWVMPAQGKLIGQFSESDNRKGIDIAGKLGQPVLASADGKVVYSGSGLRGYGKLIIIKHNNTFLSAYAHNDKVLVKEGQSVTRGQEIAEMGSTDANQVELHFEVRRFGKPVDPAKYLPLGKS